MPKTAVRHKVGSQINHPFTALQFAHYPYLSWHSQKETKHPANTYSVRESSFSSKAESSKPPHHSVGSSGRAARLRTLTERNSWTNNGAKKKNIWDGRAARTAAASQLRDVLDSCPPLSYLGDERCPQCVSGLSAMRGGELAASATSGYSKSL